MHIREEAIVRVWDLHSEEVRVLDAADGVAIRGLEFTDDGDLWVASGSKLRRWQLAAEPPRIVADIDLSAPDGTPALFEDLSSDGRLALLGESADVGSLFMLDLETLVVRDLAAHAGRAGWEMAIFDPTGRLVVSTDERGHVRVGPLTGEEPHLLPGREGAVAVSPDGRWIASGSWIPSGSFEYSIRLWPMPDLSQPPLHTLPRDELVAKLRSLTNLRAVQDPTSPSGWKIEPGPFPGWEEVPTW
jgi:WD40 repeat protein